MMKPGNSKTEAIMLTDNDHGKNAAFISIDLTAPNSMEVMGSTEADDQNCQRYKFSRDGEKVYCISKQSIRAIPSKGDSKGKQREEIFSADSHGTLLTQVCPDGIIWVHKGVQKTNFGANTKGQIFQGSKTSEIELDTFSQVLLVGENQIGVTLMETVKNEREVMNFSADAQTPTQVFVI